MRRAALVALVLAGLTPPTAAARRPVLAYVDATGTFQLYDAETGAAVPPPRLPSGLDPLFRRVSVSHNGRFVVYVANQRVHLVDRETNLEKRLPGLPAIGTGAFVTVTNDGDRIAHDAGSNGPVTIYDRSDGALVANTLPADFRQPVLSGDGSRVVGTRLFGCGSTSSGSDVCLHRMSDFGEITLAENPNDDEDPCINGNGLLLAVTIPNPTMHDLFEIDLSGGGNALVQPPGTATAGADERFCAIDSAGDHIGYQVNGAPLKLYERTTDTFITLPADVATDTTLAALVEPYAAPPSTGARKPVVAYLDGGGLIHLYDAASDTQQTLAAPVIPVGLGQGRWSISHDGRYIVWLDASSALHLFDRAGAGGEVSLPGIDQFTTDASTRPGSLTVSDGGLIAFDVNTSSGPTRAYDSVAKTFVNIGFAADSNNAQSQVSGNGRFLATSCKVATLTCAPDLGPDDSVYLQDLLALADAGLPENPTGQTDKDEQHPCVSGDGSLVGMDVPIGTSQRDIVLYDRAAVSWITLPPNVNDLDGVATNDTGCRLDTSGRYVGFDDGAFNFHVYDRVGDGFLLLPPGASSPTASVWLTQPYPPPPPPSPATGSGGGGAGGDTPGLGGGGEPGPPAPQAAARDTTAPRLTVRIRKRQRVRRGFVAVVSCNERCGLTVKAKIGTRRGVALGTKRRALRTGSFRARFRISRRKAAQISRLLRRSHNRSKVVVTVRAVDAAGNAASRKVVSSVR